MNILLMVIDGYYIGKYIRLMAIGGYSVISHWWLLRAILLMVIVLLVIVGYYMLYYNYWWLLYDKLLFDIFCYNIIGYW